MSKSLYSRVNKVYFRSYLLFNIVASSAYIKTGNNNFTIVWKNEKVMFRKDKNTSIETL